MADEEDQHKHASRLVGIPVRLREETVLDYDKYMGLVDSVRAHVAAYEDQGKQLDLTAAQRGWMHVCDSLRNYAASRDVAEAVRRSPDGARRLVMMALKDSPTVQVYMAFTGATLDQVMDGVVAFALADHGPMPAPPIGEPTP